MHICNVCTRIIISYETETSLSRVTGQALNCYVTCATDYERDVCTVFFFKQNDFVFVENCFVPTFLSTHLFKCLNCAIGIFSLTFLSYTSSTKSRTLYKINLIRFEYNISESKHHERYNINLPSFHYECNVRQSECVYSVYLFLFREFACTFLLFRL